MHPREASGCPDNESAATALPFVSVAIRVKPVPDYEQVALWAKDEEPVDHKKTICCHRGYMLEEHEFSRVIGPEDSNRKIFEDLSGPALAASVFAGVNETLIAYGQTGSGKTHTIFGAGEEPGLLGFFVSCIFDHALQVAPSSTVHVCCYEVQGDTLTDLIDPRPLMRRGEIQTSDVVYDELFLKTHKCKYQIVRVERASVCMRLLDDARRNRTAGVSSCNADSSRSHAVVHVFVQNPEPKAAPVGAQRSGTATIGAMSLVDLAGAEREHENPSLQGRKSARLLNTSLSSLNRLLRKLQMGSLDESERRQSVLNKCLWEYLRPGCGIALIFCVSPVARHRSIALSTLAMATDSKLIRSRRRSQFVAIPDPAPVSWAAPPARLPGTPSSASRARGHSQPGERRSCGFEEQRPWLPAYNSRPVYCASLDLRSEGGSLPSTPRSRASVRSCRHLPGARTPLTTLCPDELTPRSASSSSSASPDRQPYDAGFGDSEAARHGFGFHPMQRRRSASAASFGCAAGGRGTLARPAFGSSAPRGTTPRQAPATSTPLTARRQNVGNADGAAEVQQLTLPDKKIIKRRWSQARSFESVSRVEQERDQLSAENAALQRECASLRTLFIQQQREQLAFWTGPFMDMVAPKAAVSLLSKADQNEHIVDNTPEPKPSSMWNSPSFGLRQRPVDGDGKEDAVDLISPTSQTTAPSSEDVDAYRDADVDLDGDIDIDSGDRYSRSPCSPHAEREVSTSFMGSAFPVAAA